MEKKKKNHSFATRLSRWVMLVLLVMMGIISYVFYDVCVGEIVSIMGNNFHGSMQSSDICISDAMSDVSVAVNNNIFDIERNLSQPDQLQPIMERIVTQNPRIRSCGISFIENYYPKKGRQFRPYTWRTDSMEVKTRQLDDGFEDYLKAEWFTEAIAKDSAYWSRPFVDGRHEARTPLVSYQYPIHDQQGKVVAILDADLSLDFMTQLLDKQDSIFEKDVWLLSDDFGAFKSYVLRSDGTFLTHLEQRRILKGNFFDHVKDYDEPGVAENTIKEMKEVKRSSKETSKPLKVNRKDTYLFYAPVTGTDWILAVTVPKGAIDYFSILLGLFVVMIFFVVIFVTSLVCRLTIKRATKPLKLLADTADKVAQGQFDTPLPTIKHHDEIHQLRDSFENMQHSLTDYIEELKETTASKASMENELKIAHGIQMSMLPKTYPAFPERNDIDIYGQVTPAKAVGGDLYDFFIRDEKLFFCIGDVSGKGVPASLVMAVTRSLFRNIAVHTTEPDKMVEGLNDALSDNNETSMFVTLFVGVLDLATGRLYYSNAGHNMPLLLTDDGAVVLSCNPNIPAGVSSNWKFTSQQIDLKAGTTLFLYTDGLNEAEDINHNQFGMERMQQIAATADNQPQSVITTMKEAVEQFVGEAEQSDDMTMFAIQYIKSLTTNP
ncbi:MAG: SpoIIE family protein phosphatase [Prevotella sp.]|nr:SpoIIE family protein phosphatase [Prevotella sp.]